MLRILGCFLFTWSLGCGQKTSSLSTTETPQPDLDQQYLTEADLNAQDLLVIAKPDVSSMIAAVRKSGVKVVVLRINSPYNTAKTFDSDLNDPEYMSAVAYYSAAYEQGMISESSEGKRETFNGVYLRPSEEIALGGKRPFEVCR